MPDPPNSSPSRPPSLPLILARELASNLATPMFVLNQDGLLVYFNDAAEQIIGKPFAEIGVVDAMEFGKLLDLTDLDGTPVARPESPSGIAFFQRRPSHQVLVATGFDGVRRTVQATAYPLFGAGEELHGVVTVFWEGAPGDEAE
jgi:PAS domain-containing protein